MQQAASQNTGNPVTEAPDRLSLDRLSLNRFSRDRLSGVLGWLAYHSAANPLLTLALAAILTCLATGLAVTRLEFRTSRLDLLSDSAAYNQRWLNYLERFGNDDDAVIVVSHTDPARVATVLQSLGSRLEADSQLTGVLYRKSVGNVASKALHLLPTAELDQLDRLLLACLQVISTTHTSQINSLPTVSAAAIPGLPNASAAMSSVGLAASQTIPPQLAQFLKDIPAALTRAQLGLDQLQQAVPAQGPLLLEDEGRLGICLARLPHLDDRPVETRAGIARLNQHLAQAKAANPDVDLWLTGMPVLEFDEGESSQRDMRNATLLSLAGIALIFVFGFGSWRMPITAVVCLAVGLLWTVGLATLTIGHLNLFSVAFGAIIAGLGIDYAIHLLTRLRSEQARFSAAELPQAIREAMNHCGKGIFTGAITTAAAFAVARLTPFKGMTELGVICALGTVACMTATVWLLPALLVLQARWLPDPNTNRAGTSKPSAMATRQSHGGWFDLSSIHARILYSLRWCNSQALRQRTMVLVCCGLLTLLATSQFGRLTYDHNLLNLQADDVPSVHAERELTRRSGQSAWFAISMAASPQQAMQLHRRLESLPSVARVEEIGSVIASATTHPETSQQVATCRLHARQLIQQITFHASQQMAQAADPSHLLGDGPLVQLVSHNAANTHNASDTLSAGHVQPASASAVDTDLTSQMQLLAQTIERLAAPEPPALADFPESVRSRMASHDGQTFLLRIFARHNLWQRENLKQFVKELESVDPRVTGHPIQTWYASGELEHSYYQAGLYAFLSIAALLMIDLGSIRLVALALLPVVLSLLQLCGLLVALHIPFNAANMIVLPLIIGIGIDDGVHIMHDFNTRSRRLFLLSANTTLAVLLTSLTTMVGFGCMCASEHRGLQSFGIVLLLGVGLCLLNSWYTLPALLSYFGQQPESSKQPAERTKSHVVTSSSASSGTSSPASQAVSRTGTGDRTEDVMPRAPREETLGASSDMKRASAASDIPIVLSLPDYPNLPI